LSVEVAWLTIVRVYALFGLVLTTTFGISTTLLRQAKLFQAVKLVEAA